MGHTLVTEAAKEEVMKWSKIALQSHLNIDIRLPDIDRSECF